MEVFSSLWLLVLFSFIFVAPLTLFLPFYMAAKARGIQKALEEIAFEMRLSRATGESSLLDR